MKNHQGGRIEYPTIGGGVKSLNFTPSETVLHDLNGYVVKIKFWVGQKILDTTPSPRRTTGN